MRPGDAVRARASSLTLRCVLLAFCQGRDNRPIRQGSDRRGLPRYQRYRWVPRHHCYRQLLCPPPFSLYTSESHFGEQVLSEGLSEPYEMKSV